MVLLALLACAIVVIAALAIRQRSATRQRVTLPDGRVMEFLVFTQGGKPAFVDKPWQRTARKILPSRFQKWLPPVMNGYIGSSNDVIAYFRLPTSPAGGQPWSGYQAEDETGFRYPFDGGVGLFGTPNPGETVVGLTLRAYPRRQKSFLLHLVSSAGTDIATYRIPNSASNTFPQWQSLPLPQSKTNGPVTLTLESLAKRGAAPRFYTSPTWHLESSDPAWKNARARYVSLLDATGNDGSWLSPQETVWKVRTTVFRERPQDFAANEQVVLTNLPIQAPGKFLPLDLTNICNGVSVNVQLFAGSGRLDISNGVLRTMNPSPGSGSHSTSSYANGMTVESWGSANPFLLVEVRNAQQKDEIQFRWSDDQGHEIKTLPGASYYGTSGGGRMYMSQPNLSNEVKSLNATITVSRPLEFEFFINPANIQPSQAR